MSAKTSWEMPNRFRRFRTAAPKARRAPLSPTARRYDQGLMTKGLQTMSTRRRLLRAEEVAEMLAMSRRQVYRWAAERRMPAIKFGPGAVRFDPEDIEAWLRQKK